MDFFAILVHREGSLKEMLMIPSQLQSPHLFITILPPLPTLLNSLEKHIKASQGPGSDGWRSIGCIFL
ncbi:hypothetical protein M422DRAFT_268663 [Sphaerobolus stellatus SS14]|uniref:Uncharacterized protein n=1 Tax=Sphaerobolus stellatus (strain SS14) TaxID=990650 RepID=A0A0C9U6J5_SPHS4|nr:hypothetical protein M422DRAFT_268663 [Sphaerobolus stellatus SS14]